MEVRSFCLRNKTTSCTPAHLVFTSIPASLLLQTFVLTDTTSYQLNLSRFSPWLPKNFTVALCVCVCVCVRVCVLHFIGISRSYRVSIKRAHIDGEGIQFSLRGSTVNSRTNIPYILESNPHPFYSFRGLRKSYAA